MRRRVTTGVGLIVLVGAAMGVGLGHGCGSAAHKMGQALVSITAEGPTAADCGACHVQQYHEWRSSAHARAWSSSVFARRTDGYRFTACLPCHAPTTALAGPPLELRAHFRSDGVTCVVCHLKDGRLAGPVAATALVHPHPVAVDEPTYRDSRLCGLCHEGTYREWLSATEPKPTCQSCHMPSVHRRVTQGTDAFSKVLVSFEKPLAQRRHDFAAPPLQTVSTQPVASAQRIADSRMAVIRLTNPLPHSLPAGDFGPRRLVLQAIFSNAAGAELARHEQRLVRALGTALAPGATAHWRFPLLPGAAAVEVSVSCPRSAGEASRPCFQQRFDLP